MQTKVNEPIIDKRVPQYFANSADDAVFKRVSTLLKTQPRVLIAIDGNSCAGKTTAAEELGARLQANVFHMDDYFLQPQMRTPERLSQPGGNVDVERFFSDVLSPVIKGETVRVVKYDCHLDRLMEPVETAPSAVTIVEGAYSMHPLLTSYYDIRLFYRVDPRFRSSAFVCETAKKC